MNSHEHHVTPTSQGHHANPVLPFSDADWAEFKKEDKHAGGAIVVLMGAIFTIGLILYSVIAITVLS